ncbi:MAG: cytochrome P450 [Acidimicrobiales bacterium]
MLLSQSDLDVTSTAFFARPDFHDVLRHLRTTAPVCRSTADTWMVTTYEDIRAVSRDPARFSSTHGVIINDPFRSADAHGSAGSIIHMDPPGHAAYRKLLNAEFTPRAVSRLEEAVRTTVREVLDRVPDGEVFDVVSAVTAPVPVLVIAALLGIGDGDLTDFRRWSDAMIEFSDGTAEDGEAAGVELFSFLSRHIGQRYDDPGTDLISLLTSAVFQGAPLSREQLLMFCLTLLVAGNETTRHLLSGGIEALSAHPDQRAWLAAHPEAIAQAGEEMLRWVTPIQAMGRTATSELELHGEAIAAGDYLVMLYASGNRDEDVFGPTAGRFDVRRPVTPTHEAFGFGEHLCLGASLARLEVRVFFEELLARFPRFEVAGEPVWTESTLVHGPRTMPVVFRR